ncbi:hypothetical protein [Neorhizobium sp. T25_27]|nr:hypothetical protein [Neorhizobium sp. T25_27]
MLHPYGEYSHAVWRESIQARHDKKQARKASLFSNPQMADQRT